MFQELFLEAPRHPEITSLQLFRKPWKQTFNPLRKPLTIHAIPVLSTFAIRNVNYPPPTLAYVRVEVGDCATSSVQHNIHIPIVNSLTPTTHSFTNMKITYPPYQPHYRHFSSLFNNPPVGAAFRSSFSFKIAASLASCSKDFLFSSSHLDFTSTLRAPEIRPLRPTR